MTNSKFTRITPATAESKPAKQWFFKQGINSPKWDEGKTVWKFWTAPQGSAFSWGVKASYYYDENAGYLLLTEVQKAKVEALRRKLWAENKTVCKSKDNPHGLDIQPKMRLFVQGAQLVADKGNITFSDPQAVWLPYSLYKADMAGRTLEAKITQKDFTDNLIAPNLFYVTDEQGEKIAGETVSIEVTGKAERRNYTLNVDSKVIVPDVVLDKAFLWEDILVYATDEQVASFVNGLIAHAGLSSRI